MKTSACPLHILPSSLFKSAFQSIGPSVLSIINASLVSGQVPAYFKNAVIHPLLKKPSLDPSLHSSFRPISKLPFISKILEKVVAKQLTAALDEHNIYDSFQSGFRRAHSTETALLRVSNDLLTHSDAGDCSVLVLLDLTAAFDTVDHHLLLERLRDWVGLSGSALEWFSSYLSERSFSVAVSRFRSSTTSLTHGVPQGSVLGPLLFLLYLLPLLHSLSSFKGLSYHLYAGDIQLYISFKPHEISKLQLLHTCLDYIRGGFTGGVWDWRAVAPLWRCLGCLGSGLLAVVSGAPWRSWRWQWVTARRLHCPWAGLGGDLGAQGVGVAGPVGGPGRGLGGRVLTCICHVWVAGEEHSQAGRGRS
uniref:Reverse transcriptase domain-containing protein n=1 Tax=Nothobranchius furzeri TaxID=105023 RepID=A0A8C6KMM3_NOTFU